MRNFVSMTEIMNLFTIEFSEVRLINNKIINKISIIVKEQIYKYKVNYANIKRTWSDDKKYI